VRVKMVHVCFNSNTFIANIIFWHPLIVSFSPAYKIISLV
jgi:hypothetical protein